MTEPGRSGPSEGPKEPGSANAPGGSGATSLLDLRERLAAVRSVMANERTFLAYQRTALTQLAVAATFIRFFDHPVLTVVGWCLLPAAVATIALGVLRYRRARARLRAMEREYCGTP